MSYQTLNPGNFEREDLTILLESIFNTLALDSFMDTGDGVVATLPSAEAAFDIYRESPNGFVPNLWRRAVLHPCVTHSQAVHTPKHFSKRVPNVLHLVFSESGFWWA